VKPKVRVTFSALSVLAGPALASENEAHAAHAAPSVTELVFPILNFLVFAFLVWRYFWPQVKATLAERRRAIAKLLDEADRTRAEARADLVDVQAKRAAQEDEARRIGDDLRREGQHLRDSIVANARRGAERIRRDAALLGEHEATQSGRQLRAELSGAVVRRAADLLRERIDDRHQARFVEGFLADVQSEVAE
jgi:F-type H+-transporting ATPase subunit b